MAKKNAEKTDETGVDKKETEAPEVQEPKAEVNSKGEAIKERSASEQKAFDQIKKILENAKTLPDIEGAESLAIKTFGENVPEELATLGEAKYIAIQKESVEENKKPITGDWVELTGEQKDKAEKDGLLIGWNPKTNEGLLKKG